MKKLPVRYTPGTWEPEEKGCECLIYLDNAATSYPKPESVYQAMDAFLRTRGANPGRAGLHCAPWAHQTLGTYPEGALRLSISFFNTISEVEQVVEALKGLAS